MWLFTEQEPCDDSCKDLIDRRFPEKVDRRITIKVSNAYPTEKDRKDAVKAEQQKEQAQASKNLSSPKQNENGGQVK